MLINEKGIYNCDKCGSHWFEKKEFLKISTDHKDLKHYEEVPVEDIKYKLICSNCGKELDIGII